jgi:hypothetical protein
MRDYECTELSLTDENLDTSDPHACLPRLRRHKEAWNQISGYCSRIASRTSVRPTYAYVCLSFIFRVTMNDASVCPETPGNRPDQLFDGGMTEPLGP